MTAPFTLTNSLVVVPSLQPAAELNLTVDQGASFYLGPLAWIFAGNSFNPASTTSSAVFRQVATDTPLVSVTTSPSSSGQIIYGAAIPNFSYFPPELAGEANQVPVLLTLYPISVSITAAGVAGLIYPFCKWKLNMVWPDATSVDMAHGAVQVNNI